MNLASGEIFHWRFSNYSRHIIQTLKMECWDYFDCILKESLVFVGRQWGHPWLVALWSMMWWNGLSLLLEGNAMLEGTSIATVSFSFSFAPALFQISFMKLPTILWLNSSIYSDVTPHQSGTYILYDSIFLRHIHYL